MGANDILAEFFRSPQLDRLINKMNPPELRDDLRQELMLILLQKPAALIEGLHRDKALNFYAARVVLNMVQSSRSPFHYAFRKDPPIPFEEWHADRHGFDPIEERAEFDARQAEEDGEVDEYRRMMVALDTFGWYHRKLFLLYLETGCNASEVERLTKIPSRSVRNSVNRVKETLRNLCLYLL
jgi:DNA-directed RNA polymerase specialized sigma24 family protein